MSNLPPNPYNISGPPQLNANPGVQMNHNLGVSHLPPGQLPPSFGTFKHDVNTNSPLPPLPATQNNYIQQVNNYNQSASSSPAFNHPGMMPPTHGVVQSSPMRPLVTPPVASTPNQNPLPPNIPSNTRPAPTPIATSSPIPYQPNFQQKQINDNAPPLIPSSHGQPVMNGPMMGPPGSATPQQEPHYPVSSSGFAPHLGRLPNAPGYAPGPINPPYGQPHGPQSHGVQTMKPPGSMTSQPSTQFTGQLQSGPPRNSPLPPMSAAPLSGPPISAGPVPGPPTGMSRTSHPSGMTDPIKSSPMPSPPTSAAVPGPPSSSSLTGSSLNGPPLEPQIPPLGINGPNLNGPSLPPASAASMFPPKGPTSGPIGIPPTSQPYPGPQRNGPPTGHMPPTYPPGPQGLPMGPTPQSSQAPPMNRAPSMGQIPPMGQVPIVNRAPPMSQAPPMGPVPPMGQVPIVNRVPPMSQAPTMGQVPPMSKVSPSIPHMSQLHTGMPQMAQPPISQPPLSQPPMGQVPISHPPMNHPQMNQPQMGPPQIGPPQMGPQQTGIQPGPQNAPQKSNMQGRYPPMPQSNYANHQAQVPPLSKPYPQQYSPQGLTQQMGQLSVTKQGFDQLWGHQTVDLMTCRNILPEFPEDPPEIRLGHQFSESPNCSPEIFRCTVNKIPDTNSLLQKSRLPLGILIHPFKDLNHLPVIQCTTIVRCRACRTYINPFVYFVDSKRWKCNLCYRVNDLPEEFQYDPVSKSYGDPSRRPEIKSATIEFIAPGEYMLRPPQPAVYLFLLDVSQVARDSKYLQVVCDTLKENLDQLPGDARTQVGFICYDAHIHYYLMSDGLTRPKEMTVIDIDDVFLPSPESLLVNLGERKELVRELLSILPQRHAGPAAPACALGAALQAAYKLMAPTGGRITVFQTCLPNVGPGALQPREDPNARSSADVQHLNPATDFYKRLALDCSGAQVAVDLFLLNGQYADLASLSGMSKFSAGTVYHIPLFKATRSWQSEQLTRMLTRYLTRKIGFEAVMRVRCTRGIAIHTFHGNFFVRSTDLLSLPNVSPDAGFGMQLTIEESLSDLQQVCFQAALLYTSSKGERRIRVHTLALPIATNLSDVLHSADQQCIIGLLSKMAVDRCATASLSEAREALINVAVDAITAYRLAANLPAGAHSSLLVPQSLRLLPLYLLALLKRKAFRTGTSTRLDDRVADMCGLKGAPLAAALRTLYPDLYPLHALGQHALRHDDADDAPDPPRLHLSAEKINSNGAYLLDDGDTMLLYVCHAVSPAFLSDTFGVAAFSQLPDEARSLPRIDSEGNALLHAFIDKLNDDRPYASGILLIKDNSPNKTIFTERLVDDRVESAFAYYEFLQHIKSQVK